jgi:hypothetical protein
MNPGGRTHHSSKRKRSERPVVLDDLKADAGAKCFEETIPCVKAMVEAGGKLIVKDGELAF